jgi:hypothetical protein
VTAVVAVLGVVVLLLAVMVVGLLRSHAEILRALHDLGVNLQDGAPQGGAKTFDLSTRAQALSSERRRGVTPEGTPAQDRISDQGVALPTDGPLGSAHDLMGVTPHGDAAAISVRDTGGLTLLAFLTSGCATCLDFWDAFGDPARRAVAGPSTRLVVLTKGPDAESPASVANLAHPELTTLMSTEAFDDYSVPIAPYFVLIDSSAGQVIGEGAASSYDQLSSLMTKALRDGGHGLGAQRSRREVLRGRRRDQPSADEALEAAGIGPGHPSLHQDPQPDRSGTPVERRPS